MWLGTVNSFLPIQLGLSIVLCLSKKDNPNHGARKKKYNTWLRYFFSGCEKDNPIIVVLKSGVDSEYNEFNSPLWDM